MDFLDYWLLKWVSVMRAKDNMSNLSFLLSRLSGTPKIDLKITYNVTDLLNSKTSTVSYKFDCYSNYLKKFKIKLVPLCILGAYLNC